MSTCYAVDLKIRRTERSKEGFELSRAVFADNMQRALTMIMQEALKVAECIEGTEQPQEER